MSLIKTQGRFGDVAVIWMIIITVNLPWDQIIWRIASRIDVS
jgi:hypothetical protein